MNIKNLRANLLTFVRKRVMNASVDIVETTDESKFIYLKFPENQNSYAISADTREKLRQYFQFVKLTDTILDGFNQRLSVYRCQGFKYQPKSQAA